MVGDRVVVVVVWSMDVKQEPARRLVLRQMSGCWLVKISHSVEI